jgi:N6-adenosine-specific RNA methylase IME4
MTKYSIIYADPPWDYKGQTQHNGKGGQETGGAIKHYSCMKLSELKTLPVNDLADEDCLLFMWTSSPHLDQAIELLKAWGFSYATVAFVWDKVKVNPGFYTMSQCEIVLVGKKGKIPSPRGSRNTRQFLSEVRGKHSEKPDEIRARIEEMFPSQRKLEMFARKSSEGWDVFGDEVDNSININDNK